MVESTCSQERGKDGFFSFRAFCASRARCVFPDSLAVGLQLGVGPLHGLQQAALLGVLDHCFVAKVVLVPRLDAEGTLRPHATHRLLNVHCPDVLQTRETNV